MADDQVRTATPAAITAAEQSRPNWKAVPTLSVAGDAIKAEAATPELDVLRQRYFGASNAAVQAPITTRAELVTLAPAIELASSAGRKVVLVENGKVIAEQG